MKRIVTLAAVVALVAPSLALAKGGNHPMAGCGLGYVLFGHNDNSPIMQVLAATTNGISGNQTFGMTTGTSGCTDDGRPHVVAECLVVLVAPCRSALAAVAERRIHQMTHYVARRHAKKLHR